MHRFVGIAAVASVFFVPDVRARDVIAGDYGSWSIDLVVVLVTAALVCVCVLLHYEVLNVLSRRLARLEGRRRRRVLYGIFGVLSVHVAEIWIFGVAYTLLLLISPAFGAVHGIASPGLLDHVYFSAMTFTTVGFGDVYPLGPVRFLAGTEALTGLVLVTWSASFTFLEMTRFWRDR
jgi:Ion channel